MSDPESPIRLALVENLKYPRYAITLNRNRFSATLYWTGGVEEPWTTEVAGAMKWADCGGAEIVLRQIEAAEPDDSPGGNRWDGDWWGA